jgi:hypothetical protein
MKLKFYHGAILGILIALIAFVDGCQAKKKLVSEIQSVNDYRDSVKHERTKNGLLLSYNNNLKLSKESLYLAVDSLEGYILDIGVKNPEVITVVKTELKTDTITIPMPQNDCVFDSSFVLDSAYYNIDGRITNDELTINSISFPNKIDLVVGYKKEKWWKKKERVATITNSNPYMNVKGISSFTLEHKKKWYNQPLFQFGIGALAGGTTLWLLTK